MQPGLSRAIPMSILGFLLGALIVIVLRGLQGIEPAWDSGAGVIVAAFTTAIFFMWGMGAFDPKMSAHGEDHDAEAHADEAHEPEEEPAPQILTGYMWQLATLLLVVVGAVGAFAFLDVLTLRTTEVADAAVDRIGMVPMELFGQEVLVSQFVIFLGFVIFTFISLIAAAAVLGWVVFSLNRGMIVAQAEAASGGSAALPAPQTRALSAGAGATATPASSPSLLARIRPIALFVFVFVVLYLVFYYVAIGLILPEPNLPGLSLFLDNPTQLVFLSAVNALLFTVILLRPGWLLRTLGVVARWSARQLRRLPNALQ